MPDVHSPLGQHRHQRDYIYKQRQGEREAAFHLERMQHVMLLKKHTYKNQWTGREITPPRCVLTSESSLLRPSWRTALGDLRVAWLDWAICRFNCQPTYSSWNTQAVPEERVWKYKSLQIRKDTFPKLFTDNIAFNAQRRCSAPPDMLQCKALLNVIVEVQAALFQDWYSGRVSEAITVWWIDSAESMQAR